MKESIDVTVIIPAYNSRETIIATLASAVAQDYDGPTEVIVVNDGSSDDTEYLVAEFIKNKAYKGNFDVKLFSKENGGVSSARNYGLKRCNGRFICFLDSDDEWLPNKITHQLEMFSSLQNAGFIGSVIREPKNYFNIKYLLITFNMMVFKNYFQPSTVMMKRSVFEKVGFFNEDQRYAEEGNYFQRVALITECYLCNTPNLVYGRGKASFGESGLSANLRAMEAGELRNLRYLRDQKVISRLLYFCALSFSCLKYVRRVVIAFTRKKLKF